MPQELETASLSKKKAKKQQDEKEMKELAKSMMSTKAKRLYDKMQYGIAKKAKKVQVLEDKAAKLLSKQSAEAQ